MMVYSMVDAIQNKNWDAYMNLMTYEQQDFYQNYFANDKCVDGVKQLESVEVRDIIYIPSQDISNELLYSEYPILNSTEEIVPFLVSLNCNVSKENVYFYNGVNYFMVVFVKENDETYKIAQFNRPSYELLYNIISKQKNTVNTEREKALNIVKYAENGVVINGEGEFITDGYVIKKIDKKSGIITDLKKSEWKSVNMLSNNNYNDHPNIPNAFFCSIPKNITVCMNRTGNSQIKTVAFDSYVKNTLPNEWYSSWNAAALKAGAYCVKGVGIYRSIKPVNVNYMVSQGTQNYIPNTTSAKTNTAVNSISNKYVVSSDGALFFPEYGAGTKGVAGTKGTGRLLQWGSQYLASEKGYTCKQILNYYYKGSPCSKESISFITYGNV